MTPADRELRSIRRDLLLARAAVERAQLAHQFDQLLGRTRGVRRVAGTLLDASRSPGAVLLGVAANALRIVRRQPWLVPMIASGVARLSRTRVLRWAVLAGAVATAAWWISRPPPPTDPAGDGDTASGFPADVEP